MKKSIHIAGISFLLILLTGVIFKRLHYPGASILVVLGIFPFIAFYLPLFLISLARQTRAEGSGINSTLIYLGFPGILVLTFGILSKIMHWPGANIGLWTGIGLLTFVFLLFLVINRKESEKIPMISVLIVVVLLGSFSFNIFRIGNFRPVREAYQINENPFSVTSKIFWRECENLIQSGISSDKNFSVNKPGAELIKMHSKVQETDLIIGKMIEKIRQEESSYLNMKQSGKKLPERELEIEAILMAEDGLPAIDLKIGEYKSLISSNTLITAGEKEKFSENLVYPFHYDNSGLLQSYIGIFNFDPDVSLNALLVWKSKIWETEYLVLTSAFKKM